MTTDARRIEELRAEARFARERYDLYRAKMYGSHPTSMRRLRELERMHQGADARLQRALRPDQGLTDPPRSHRSGETLIEPTI